MGFFNLFNTSVSIQIDESNVVTVHNRKEAEFYAAGMLKIAFDCANLINTTKNPKVFFERYNLLIEKFENLSKIERFGCFKGKLPSQNLKEILGKKENTINDFIDRYYNETLSKFNSLKTEKAKLSCIDAFCNGLNYYKHYLSEDSLNKYNELCSSLNKKN